MGTNEDNYRIMKDSYQLVEDFLSHQVIDSFLSSKDREFLLYL
jgi:hypothetical protein